MVGEDQVEEVVKTLMPDDIHISDFEFAKPISGVQVQLLHFNSIVLLEGYSNKSAERLIRTIKEEEVVFFI